MELLLLDLTTVLHQDTVPLLKAITGRPPATVPRPHHKDITGQCPTVPLPPSLTAGTPLPRGRLQG